MAAEHKLLRHDQLFDDGFPFEETLTEVYFTALQNKIPEGHDNEGRYHAYAAADKIFVAEYGVYVSPETFHQAFDLDKATPEAVITTAERHYKQLRDIGIKVVGHAFEPINDTEHFALHPKYPTILAGAKYIHSARPTDRPKDSQDIGGSLTSHEIGTLDIDKILLEPLREYFEWCQKSNQEYVLSQLNYLSSYIYHVSTGSTGLQSIESSLGSVEHGSLRTQLQDFEDFARQLKTKATKK
jgi:hypothetical protein